MSENEGRDWNEEVAQRLVEQEVAENLRREKDAISLRDHFAATALLGLLNGSVKVNSSGSSRKTHREFNGHPKEFSTIFEDATAVGWHCAEGEDLSFAEVLAESAYILADAMLRMRSEIPSK